MNGNEGKMNGNERKMNGNERKMNGNERKIERKWMEIKGKWKEMKGNESNEQPSGLLIWSRVPQTLLTLLTLWGGVINPMLALIVSGVCPLAKWEKLHYEPISHRGLMNESYPKAKMMSAVDVARSIDSDGGISSCPFVHVALQSFSVLAFEWNVRTASSPNPTLPPCLQVWNQAPTRILIRNKTHMKQSKQTRFVAGMDLIQGLKFQLYNISGLLIDSHTVIIKLSFYAMIT